MVNTLICSPGLWETWVWLPPGFNFSQLKSYRFLEKKDIFTTITTTSGRSNMSKYILCFPNCPPPFKLSFILQRGEKSCNPCYPTPYTKSSHDYCPMWPWLDQPYTPSVMHLYACNHNTLDHSQSQSRHCASLYYIYLCFIVNPHVLFL